ncbi:hypothetical protein PghCCS26_16140 [Paenibacillus glycanilyticus]|uniref:Uncharacterized protein n=1 Tax=Paenibacillus glycanilyticus TaxID=126569 RepID=A0ABQ6NHB0_9BACL|nr:hypothetical protein PghCCS26_16140 [Paenibacillus glycanilyticus]
MFLTALLAPCKCKGKKLAPCRSQLFLRDYFAVNSFENKADEWARLIFGELVTYELAVGR